MGEYGAVWRGETKKGDPKLTIKIGDRFYTAVENKYKEGGDNRPDWIILLDEE